VQHYGGRFLMYAMCVCVCVCVCVCARVCARVCVRARARARTRERERERGGGMKAFLELHHNPLFGQLLWVCIILVLLLFTSWVMTSVFYFNIIDDGWGRTRGRLNSPVATNVKSAFIPLFIHGSQ
jgi:ABC-type Fe3+ transport system permease subunit